MWLRSLSHLMEIVTGLEAKGLAGNHSRANIARGHLEK